jgi:exodeoxyribonuclease VII small subunit
MKKQTFEAAIKKLEQIVLELETKDLPLDEAVKKFEEGVNLSKFCSKVLDETEKKVTILLKKDDGKIIKQPFVDANNLNNE